MLFATARLGVNGFFLCAANMPLAKRWVLFRLGVLDLAPLVEPLVVQLEAQRVFLLN